MNGRIECMHCGRVIDFRSGPSNSPGFWVHTYTGSRDCMLTVATPKEQA